MATLNELKKYLNYEFSSGCRTGEDYKQFETKYINYVRSLCKKNGWEVVAVHKNHYEFSMFLCDKATGKCIYLSIADVRYNPNQWYNRVLVRQARDICDYTGGFNEYTQLPDLEGKIKMLLKRSAL